MTNTTAQALRALAQAIETLADSLTGKAPETVEVVETPAPVEAAPEAPVIKLPQLRDKLAELSRSGHTAQVRELIQATGAEKLSDVDPSQYASLLAAAEQVAA